MKTRAASILALALAIPAMGFALGLFVGVAAEPMFSTADLDPPDTRTTATAFARNNGALGWSLMVIGFLTYGLGSAALLALNGFLTGQLLRALVVDQRLDAVATGLAPHAFVEVGGLVACAGAGVLFVHALLRRVVLHSAIGPRLPLAAAVTAAGGFLLIAVAALIEASWSTVALS